ncbi:MAG: hypothetical protein IKJ65_08710 [Clostridia bacterium]|nr:hypothetical protein [Clostridia bacterium]
MLSEGTITKMSAKRILFFLLFVVCLISAGAIAYADEPLSAVCAFTPADFIEPCAAKLSISIHNTSDKQIENVRIQQEGSKEAEAIGAIDPGETMHYSIDIQVTKKILDAGKVDFTLTYKAGNKNQKMQISAKATRVSNLASVQLTSRIFKTAIYAGESTQAEYRLLNTGAVAAENAVVSDPAFGFTSSAFTLAPGEEKVFTAIHTFYDNAISSPRADFVSQASGNPYVAHAPSVALHVAEDNFAFSIEPATVSVKYADRAHFSVSIKNNSLLSYKNLLLTVENLGAFPAESAYMKPGDVVTLRIETPPVTSSGLYPIRFTAREAGGSERTYLAGEMNISVSGEENRNPLISVIANPDGSAPFTFTITGANRDIKNARLSEKTLGSVKTFLVIKAGTETVFSPALSVNKGEAFEFSLSWDENGETYSVSATPLLSQFTSSEDIHTDLTDAVHASLYAMVNATHLPKIVMFACICLAFVILASFLIAKFVRAKKRRRQARQQLGRTSKFAPIRTRDAEKEN